VLKQNVWGTCLICIRRDAQRLNVGLLLHRMSLARSSGSTSARLSFNRLLPLIGCSLKLIEWIPEKLSYIETGNHPSNSKRSELVVHCLSCPKYYLLYHRLIPQRFDATSCMKSIWRSVIVYFLWSLFVIWTIWALSNIKPTWLAITLITFSLFSSIILSATLILNNNND
jgi:hypothetical protein